MLLLEGNSSGIDAPYLAILVGGLQAITRRQWSNKTILMDH